MKELFVYVAAPAAALWFCCMVMMAAIFLYFNFSKRRMPDWNGLVWGIIIAIPSCLVAWGVMFYLKEHFLK